MLISYLRPSVLSSRLHPVTFLQTPWGFISLQNICYIFSQICISHHVWEEIFELLVFKLLENVLVRQPIKCRYFYPCSLQAILFPTFLLSLPRQNEITHSLKVALLQVSSFRKPLYMNKMAWKYSFLCFPILKWNSRR